MNQHTEMTPGGAIARAQCKQWLKRGIRRAIAGDRNAFQDALNDGLGVLGEKGLVVQEALNEIGEFVRGGRFPIVVNFGEDGSSDEAESLAARVENSRLIGVFSGHAMSVDEVAGYAAAYMRSVVDSVGLTEAGAGGRDTASPQRQAGRVNWALLLLLSATVVGWASIVKVGGHRLGWW